MISRQDINTKLSVVKIFCTKKAPNPSDDLEKMGNAFSDYNIGSLYRWERRK